MDALCSHSDDAQALLALLSREHFERVECIQEVGAASVCIGKSEDLKTEFLSLTLPIPAMLQ